MNIPKIFVLFAFLLIAACGSQETLDFDTSVVTQAPPVISRLDPSTASAGDTVTIFGFGFSIAKELNMVSVDSSSAYADTYDLVASPTSNEVEQLTFTVPADVSAGTSVVTVTVFDNVSNSLELTIQ